MKIKVCGLSNPDNMNQVIGLHPDYIGIIFYRKSKRYIGQDPYVQTILRSIRTVLKIGVFVNAGYREILTAIDQYGLNLVQLHGAESANFCACLSGHIPIIKAFQINASFDFNQLQDYKESCTYFLFDTASDSYGGSGHSFDWQLLQKYTLPTPFLLSGGISLDNINSIKEIKHAGLIGIDVNSCFETAPGIKNINNIKTLLHEFRN